MPKWSVKFGLPVVGVVLAVSACAIGDAQIETGGNTMALQITSQAFGSGQAIPVRYSCHGEDISPPLVWTGAPAGTLSFALVFDDPDAPIGTWVHWVVYNMPTSTNSLPEAVAPDTELADGSRHGKNSWGRLGYGGPCPPMGTHHYFFRLYALDIPLQLPADGDKKALLKAMEGHILGQAELMGTFAKP